MMTICRMSYCVFIGKGAGISNIDGDYCICIGAGNDVRDPYVSGQVNIYGLQFTNIPVAKCIHAVIYPTFRWLGQRKWGVSVLKAIGDWA